MIFRGPWIPSMTSSNRLMVGFQSFSVDGNTVSELMIDLSVADRRYLFDQCRSADHQILPPPAGNSHSQL